jgi:hypothetical protein
MLMLLIRPDRTLMQEIKLWSRIEFVGGVGDYKSVHTLLAGTVLVVLCGASNQ